MYYFSLLITNILAFSSITILFFPKWELNIHGKNSESVHELVCGGKNRFGKEFDPCWCPVGEVGAGAGASAGAGAQWEKWQGKNSRCRRLQRPLISGVWQWQQGLISFFGLRLSCLFYWNQQVARDLWTPQLRHPRIAFFWMFYLNPFAVVFPCK